MLVAVLLAKAGGNGSFILSAVAAKRPSVVGVLLYVRTILAVFLTPSISVSFGPTSRRFVLFEADLKAVLPSFSVASLAECNGCGSFKFDER